MNKPILVVIRNVFNYRMVANSADPDQTPQNAASDLGLHCLLRPVCPNTWDHDGSPSQWRINQIVIDISRTLPVINKQKSETRLGNCIFGTYANNKWPDLACASTHWVLSVPFILEYSMIL